MESNKFNISFIVWKKYQRRVEVLAPILKADPKFFPHLFINKYMRPFDYLIKLVINLKDILQQKPNFIIAQCPPLFSAISALIMGVPYIIDAHNSVFQGIWGKLPLSRYIIEKSCAVIVHNSEILELAKKIYPSKSFYNISDPIEYIPSFQEGRQAKQILVICSFDPWDEPVDTIIDTIQKLTDYTFIITADVKKISAEQRWHLQQCSNVRLTGFLDTKDYQAILCSSLAALVLTTRPSTQPSGACEALSSDTQLIVSKTSLTDKLFGEWAVLVENSTESIGQAIKSLYPKPMDLSSYRHQWNMSVQQEASKLRSYIEECISFPER